MITAYSSTAMEIWLKYIIYASITAIGIVALMFIKRASRPPKHTELRARMTELISIADDLERYAQNDNTAHNKIKSVNELILKIKKLIMTTDALAQAEQDSDIDSLTVILEHARNELAAYKASKYKDSAHLSSARKSISDAIELLDRVIERDAQLKNSRR